MAWGRAGTRQLAALVLALLVAGPGIATLAAAQGAPSAPGAPEPPLLGHLTPRGGVTWLGEAGPGEAAVPKAVDGHIADWVGEATRLGGTTVLDRGELVYQDFPFDAHGADDGRDAQRRGAARHAEQAVPSLQRLEALSQALGAQFDLEAADPTGGVVVGKERFGDAAPPQDAEGHADLLEVRVAADAEQVFLLARFVTLHDAALPALLLLADTDAAARELAAPRPVPFGSGLASTRAEAAYLVTGAGVLRAALDQAGGPPSHVPGARVAVNPEGYVNAVEVALPRSLLAPEGTLRLAVAAGIATRPGGDALLPVATGEGRAHVLNAAFRREDRVSVWFDHDQAMALLQGSVDPFLVDVPLPALERGWSQPWQATAGTHARLFLSSAAISEERGHEGIHQAYSLHLPRAWIPGRAEPWPVTFWLPWRGAHAHTHAAWAPRLLEQLADDRDALVVAPEGRGARSWYVGTGHQDFHEVWNDVHRSFAVDPLRVTVAGISMGGYGAYLLALLYPDRFAAAWPIAGPITQGAWLGLDEGGGDVVETNDGDAAAQLAYRIVENALHVPFLIFHNTADQVVPPTGVARTALRFEELGYRHRLVAFPGYEHHTTAVMDEWRLGAAWFDAHPRVAQPGRVVYKVSPTLERAVETVHAGNATLDFTFDGAYWLRGLSVRDADPDDPGNHGLADVRSLALPAPAHQAVPDRGAGAVVDGHTVPHVWTGTAWLTRPAPSPRNAVEARFVNVGRASLDLAAMGLDPTRPLALDLTTDGPLVLRLGAAGRTAGAGAEVLVLELEAGHHVLETVAGAMGADVDTGSVLQETQAAPDRPVPGLPAAAGSIAAALAATALATAKPKAHASAGERRRGGTRS